MFAACFLLRPSQVLLSCVSFTLLIKGTIDESLTCAHDDKAAFQETTQVRASSTWSAASPPGSCQRGKWSPWTGLTLRFSL